MLSFLDYTPDFACFSCIGESDAYLYVISFLPTLGLKAPIERHIVHLVLWAPHKPSLDDGCLDQRRFM